MPKKEETWFQNQMREEMNDLLKKLTVDEEMHGRLASLFSNENFIYLVGLSEPRRPGVHLFATELELLYFPPGTSANEDFNLAILNQGSAVWWIVIVPKIAMNIVKDVAQECDLQLVDGTPLTLGSKGKKDFPLSNKRVFVLENLPGSTVYIDPKEETEKALVRIKNILAEENEKIKKIREIFNKTK